MASEIYRISFWSTPQHDSNHATEEFTYTSYIYPSEPQWALPNAALAIDALNTFVDVSTVTGSSTVKHALNFSSGDYYHDGSGWTSTTSVTNTAANTANEINTNASTFSPPAGESLKVRTFLDSNGGTSTSSIESVTFNYDFRASAPAALPECQVYGYVSNLLGDNISSGSVTVDYNDYIAQSSRVVLPGKTSNISIDSTGYFDVSLIETETSGLRTSWTFNYTQDGETKKLLVDKIVIPNTDTADFSTLTGVA